MLVPYSNKPTEVEMPTYTKPAGTKMTEPQGSLLIDLIFELYANAPKTRQVYLGGMVDLDFNDASSLIDTLLKAKKLKAPNAEAKKVQPAYGSKIAYDTSMVLPAKYLIDGEVWQIKKPKYGTGIQGVIQGDGYGKWFNQFTNEGQAILAKLTDKDFAYAATVAYAKAHPQHKCGVCHTKLSNPKSIAAGIGPDCAKKYGYKI